MKMCKALSLTFLIMLASPCLLPIDLLDLVLLLIILKLLCALLVALVQVHISASLLLAMTLRPLWPSVPSLLLRILLLHFFLCLSSLLLPHHLLCLLCFLWFLRMPHFLLLLLHPQFAHLVFPMLISLNLVMLLVHVLLFFMARMGHQLRLLFLLV